MRPDASRAQADVDVVVVGAGLAGLRCALAVQDAGLSVRVLERADAVGGRVRTDRVDGFLLDRGFQLLNPSYPALRRGIDVEALGLQSFDAGVAARTESGLARLGHPWHAPRLIPSSARGVLPDALDGIRLARWLRPLLRRPGRPLRPGLDARADAPLRESLDAAGVGGLPRRVIDAFLAGVVLDDTGATSTHYAHLLVNSFVAGTPGLPRAGMQALPEQLAARLHRPVETGVTVLEVRAGATPRVRTEAGEIRARHVVVATDGATAAALAGTPAPAPRGVVTTWFTTPTAPVAGRRARLLHVDAREVPRGPLVNVAVVSAAAPTYAPAGRHLVAASALLDTAAGRVPSDDALRDHAGGLLGTPVSDWEVVHRYEIPFALPAQPPPLRAAQPVGAGEGVLVCGDHRDTASIQGALVSGERAARHLLRTLGAGRVAA